MIEEISHDVLVKIVRRQENDIISHKLRIDQLEAKTDNRRTRIAETTDNFRGYHTKPMYENEKEWSDDIHNIKLRLETCRVGALRKIRIQENKEYKQIWINFEDATDIDERETKILKDYGYVVADVKIENEHLSVRAKK